MPNSNLAVKYLRSPNEIAGRPRRIVNLESELIIAGRERRTVRVGQPALIVDQWRDGLREQAEPGAKKNKRSEGGVFIS